MGNGTGMELQQQSRGLGAAQVVWPLTAVLLLASAAITVVSLDQGWGDAGQLISGGIGVVALLLLTLAARAISNGSGVGEGFVSALVTVFLLIPLAAFLFFASSALGVVNDFGDALGSTGTSGADDSNDETDQLDQDEAPVDLDGDGLPDSDFDGDGVPDDFNGNGVPDTMEGLDSSLEGDATEGGSNEDFLEASLPELSAGCEAILLPLGDSLLNDPVGTIQRLDATYGRAGEAVVGAAERAAEDVRLIDDADLVISDACDG